MNKMSENFQEYNQIITNVVETSNSLEEYEFVAWENLGNAAPQSEKHQLTEEEEEVLSEIEIKQQELEQRAQLLDAKEQELQKQINEFQQRVDEQEKKEQELAGLVNEVTKISAACEKIKKGFWVQNSQEIVEFSIALVEKLISKSIDTNPEVLANHIKMTLEDVKVDESILIHLAPQDLELLQNSKVGTVFTLLNSENIKWISDLRLARGEVYIDTSQYRLDASLKTAILNMKEDLLTNTGKDEETNIHEMMKEQSQEFEVSHEENILEDETQKTVEENQNQSDEVSADEDNKDKE